MREREARRTEGLRPLAHLEYECTREYGAEWFHNPARWPTSDGVVPWTEFLVACRALWALRAIDRLNTARAIGVAFSGDTPEGKRLRAAEMKEAFPDGK